MSRSLKKPPFVHYKLMKRVEEAKESSKKTVIKTWSRASTITPDFVKPYNCRLQWNEIYSSFHNREYGGS